MIQQAIPGERLSLSLVSWGKTGEALAFHEGQEVRVSGGIPGEEVTAEVIKYRREYIAAQVVEVLTPSPYRVEPPCPYFGPCTGCQWQHIEYQQQLHIKRQMVVEALDSVNGFTDTLVLSTLPSPEQYGYRNHARFTVGRRKGELGFVNRESRRFIVVQECLLMHPWINEALGQLQGKCAETSQLSIRYGVNTNDFLIQPAMKSPEVPLQSGRKYYAESLSGQVYRIAASSFFQVNTQQAERMMELVRDELHIPRNEDTSHAPSLLVDAYAGVGTFAIMLAPYADKVLAIEESKSAVGDAQINAQDIEGVEFLLGKTEEVLARIEERPQGVILDPPRAGCHRDTLDALAQLAPSRVVYVSCDLDTLARDLEILCGGPFRLERVQPVDMFPQTHHVECIASLSWDGSVL
ncbi:MAG: class I SAM-dependent RNA methyltransferase [Dehalococcoidia bacterium]|nr:class I SAM-dependent RNA methyltransferase [Dehalococcoidia bacterium]